MPFSNAEFKVSSSVLWIILSNRDTESGKMFFSNVIFFNILSITKFHLPSLCWGAGELSEADISKSLLRKHTIKSLSKAFIYNIKYIKLL